MAINLKQILISDTDNIKLDKVNYNFDQLVANGGGPQVHRVLMELQVFKELLDIKVFKEKLVIKEFKVLKVLMDKIFGK